VLICTGNRGQLPRNIGVPRSGLREWTWSVNHVSWRSNSNNDNPILKKRSNHEVIKGRIKLLGIEIRVIIKKRIALSLIIGFVFNLI
jgi:hypothetical protein